MRLSGCSALPACLSMGAQWVQMTVVAPSFCPRVKPTAAHIMDVDLRLDALGLPVRMVIALKRNGFITLGDVARRGVMELLGPGIGPETARRLRFELDRRGIAHDIPRRFVKRIV